jgi:hypothetical protein
MASMLWSILETFGVDLIPRPMALDGLNLAMKSNYDINL